ncbi:hypothetical protein BDW02DRAFT_512543, partial [Decorospora gaudefroyi]
LSTILVDFLRYYRITYLRKTNIYRGVFRATLYSYKLLYKRKRLRGNKKLLKLYLYRDNYF